MKKTGPFGLEMGMTKEDMDFKLVEIAPYVYAAEALPKSHSAFEAYTLKITPNFGLSWIKAMGKTLQTSVYGTELRMAFDSMLQRLSKSYGKHKLVDFLHHD